MAATKTQVRMEEEEMHVPPEVQVFKFISGFTTMAVVKCAIDLGIAEAIEKHGGRMTLSALASALRCEPSSLNRIMRFLCNQRVFKAKPTSDGGSIAYEQTPISRCLMGDAPNSMAALVLLETSPAVVASWFNLSAGILADGRPAFIAAHGIDEWDLAETDAAHSKLIHDAMACIARGTVPAIIERCPKVFDGVGSLVDVGGGSGTASRLLVKAFPWIKGINFDLPHAISVAEECEGVVHVAGDMFQSIPKADAVFLMRVLHDWGDNDCIKILKKCREAIPSDKGKLIIVEIVIDDERAGEEMLKSPRLMIDMAMMAHTGAGKERTFKEWEYVLGQAGFTRFNVQSMHEVQSVIEAYR